MSDKVLAVFHAALKRYAINKAGDYLAGGYIGIPHRLPPKLVFSVFDPPDAEAGDTYVRGDHDFHRCVSLIDGLDYTGHQAIKVQALAASKLRLVLGSDWQERVLCDLYTGTPMSDPDYRRLAEPLLWDGVWPEVDGDRCLTGRLVSDEDGYANVMNEAMMQEDVAKAAGLVVEDGYVHLKQEAN